MKRPEAGKGTIGRPLIARVLIEKGYFSTIQEVFDELVSYGRPAYVVREKISTKEAIQLINKAGGISVLAHPFHGFSTWKQLENDIYQMMSWGLQGIELYYDYDGHYTDGIEPARLYDSKMRELISANDLVVSAGSDFHGDRGSIGTQTIPEKDLCVLLERAGQDRIIAKTGLSC